MAICTCHANGTAAWICVEEMSARQPAASVYVKSPKFVGEISDAKEWFIVQVRG